MKAQKSLLQGFMTLAGNLYKFIGNKEKSGHDY
jgi:hypothetical protein